MVISVNKSTVSSLLCNLKMWNMHIQPLIDKKESVVLVNPTSYNKMALKVFEKAGYVVKHLNLKDVEQSDSWDILGEIRKDPERADIMARVICDKFHDEYNVAARSLIKALLLYVASDEKIKDKGYQNIVEVANMLFNLDDEEFFNCLFDSSRFSEGLESAVLNYISYKKFPKSFRSIALGMATDKFLVFLDDSVKKIVRTKDIDFSLPSKMPCAYIITLPTIYPSRDIIAKLALSFLLFDLVESAGEDSQTYCKVPVHIYTSFCNEVKPLMRMSANKAQSLADRGIWIHFPPF